MKSFFLYTKREKSGAIDALNLFFGALLGANLGTLGSLALPDYINLVVLLAATVTFLRLVSTSERRGFVLVVLAAYLLLLSSLVTVPGMKPDGMTTDDLHRLVATLAVWVVFLVITEFSPNIEHRGKSGRAKDDQA
ncbi:MAG TPA: hypothetical protein VF582_06320 [Allosphingosinicella sp.]|jgi:uncharacterized membrane protein YccC